MTDPKTLSTALLAIGLSFPAVAAEPDLNPQNDVYFGNFHIHSSWSFDAYINGFNGISGFPAQNLEAGWLNESPLCAMFHVMWNGKNLAEHPLWAKSGYSTHSSPGAINVI